MCPEACQHQPWFSDWRPFKGLDLFGLNVSRHNLTRSVGAGATWSHRDGGALALAPAGLNPEAVTVGPWTCPPEPQFSPCSGRTPVRGTQRSQDVWQLGSRLPPLWPLHRQVRLPAWQVLPLTPPHADPRLGLRAPCLLSCVWCCLLTSC